MSTRPVKRASGFLPHLIAAGALVTLAAILSNLSNWKSGGASPTGTGAHFTLEVVVDPDVEDHKRTIASGKNHIEYRVRSAREGDRLGAKILDLLGDHGKEPTKK